MSPLISGRVLDPMGAPVSGASVFFVEGPTSLPDVAQITGEDGAFSLSAPVAGRYRLGARSGDAQGDLDVDVAAGGTSDIQLKI